MQYHRDILNLILEVKCASVDDTEEIINCSATDVCNQYQPFLCSLMIGCSQST